MDARAADPRLLLGLLEFEDGTPCTIVHNGYGYFLGNELVPWGSSIASTTRRRAGRDPQAMPHGDPQRRRRTSRTCESAVRRSATSSAARGPRAWMPRDLGIVVVMLRARRHAPLRSTGSGSMTTTGCAICELTGRRAAPAPRRARGALQRGRARQAGLPRRSLGHGDAGSLAGHDAVRRASAARSC